MDKIKFLMSDTGAVTHVLVNDPTRGYGIFAQTMLEQAEQVATAEK